MRTRYFNMELANCNHVYMGREYASDDGGVIRVKFLSYLAMLTVLTLTVLTPWYSESL